MMVYGRAECDAQTKTRDPIDRRRMLMALTTITCVQREAVDACHDINTLNVQMPLPPPKDNRRLWLHHLNVWPSLFSSRGRPFT